MSDTSSDYAAAQFADLFRRLSEDAKREGVLIGRREERKTMRAFLEQYDAAFPLEAGAQPSHTAKSEGEPARRFASGMLSELVARAVRELAPTNPEGADPPAIFGLLQSQGQVLDPQQVRQALRNLTSAGTVNRVSRGRYLPADRAPEPRNEPDRDPYFTEAPAHTETAE